MCRCVIGYWWMKYTYLHSRSQAFYKVKQAVNNNSKIPFLTMYHFCTTNCQHKNVHKHHAVHLKWWMSTFKIDILILKLSRSMQLCSASLENIWKADHPDSFYSDRMRSQNLWLAFYKRWCILYELLRDLFQKSRNLDQKKRDQRYQQRNSPKHKWNTDTLSLGQMPLSTC